MQTLQDKWRKILKPYVLLPYRWNTKPHMHISTCSFFHMTKTYRRNQALEVKDKVNVSPPFDVIIDRLNCKPFFFYLWFIRKQEHDLIIWQTFSLQIHGFLYEFRTEMLHWWLTALVGSTAVCLVVTFKVDELLLLVFCMHSTPDKGLGKQSYLYQFWIVVVTQREFDMTVL